MGRFGLDCKACNDNQKIERGCLEDSPIPDKWEAGEHKFSRCPLKMIKQDSFWYIRAYNFMEKGVLPRAGGWLDQSNKYIEAMSCVIAEIGRINKEGSHG